MTEKADSLTIKLLNLVELSASGSTGIGALLLIVCAYALGRAVLAVGKHLKKW